MIAYAYSSACALGFSVYVCYICGHLILKNRLSFFIDTAIWDGFKIYGILSFIISGGFAKSDFLSFIIVLRSTPIIPLRVLHLARHFISNLSVCNSAARKRHCLTCYPDIIIYPIGFCDRFKVSLKLRSLVFFYFKIELCVVVFVCFRINF